MGLAPTLHHVNDDRDFTARLADVLAHVAPGTMGAVERLSGGANMESWSIDWHGADGAVQGYILRRAPNDEWLAGRPFGLGSEAALVRAARAGGVLAPQVVADLAPADGLGHGYVMRRVDAAVNPATLLAQAAPHLIDDIARELARIHALPVADLPADIPVLDTAAGLAELQARYIGYGADRPILALALRWLHDNIPPPAPARLVHGDLRMGNIMATPAGLAAVLDWELAHIGDAHDDLAYGCMTVWRFGQIDRPAFGLASVERYAAAYERAGGVAFDPARFRFWLVYRTLWWALGCLQMGAFWRSGVDAALERTVIARRTSENELDLLLLLEEDAPPAARAAGVAPLRAGGGDDGRDDGPKDGPKDDGAPPLGETTAAEILSAINDWLANDVKPKSTGRDKFMVAVAMNALGIVGRELAHPVAFTDRALSDALLAGTATLATPGVLARLRAMALAKLTNDMPKYAALAHARALWRAPPAE
ncbi:MAG: phosphotransferase [Sphingopyxis sp.]